ncbi:MAG: D-glycero-beta-D-manno-heptose 1,7-bisphosphate 7-phosphatase [Lachnospiraceae bacterium]|nr:D-glycero-beta-D-manno-heptose 1,7-bisphosphate 7-phosphatase [Lachnospiraceae bacterium]
MKTVIMAGGKGTRIQSVVSDIPKPMIKIGKIPVLEYEIKNLVKQGFTDIIITVSHLGHIIKEYFGDGSFWGANITYYEEEYPLGNGGALFFLRRQLDSDFLLLNADVVFDVDFHRFVKFHKEKGGLVTLFTHPNSHPYDSGLIIADENGRVKKWLAKEEERPQYYKNLVNAGLHIINPAVLDMVDAGNIYGRKREVISEKIDLDRQILKPLVQTGQVFSYNSPEYVKDMGTPDRLQVVEKDFLTGRIKAKNLRNKQRAIFLDRDGTINIYKGFLRNINDFELIQGIGDAIQRINEQGYLAIVVTNQPVIARGELSKEELEEIHNRMETELGREGAYLDGIYVCPHHPDKGYEGEVVGLKIDCACRKPKPGMLLCAEKDFNINLEESWMVGDRESDIKAGRAAGCKTALVGWEDYGQDVTVASVADFVEHFVKGSLFG